MTRKTEDFEVCYPAERGGLISHEWRPLLDELGIPVIMLTDPYDVGRGYNDRPSPRIPFWAARVLNWMGLSAEERETALRRLVAEPVLRATVRDLTQLVRTDSILISLQSFSFRPDDMSGQLPTWRLLHAVATPETRESERLPWSVRYDASTGAILGIKTNGDPMPLHIAIEVQAAIDEFMRGEAVMHALGSSR